VDYEQILYEVKDRVAVVTLNRPEKLNAMTAQMGAEMADAMGAADADDEVRAVVVTGAGRGFCAGADLGGGGQFAAGWGTAERSKRARSPQQVRKPVIAAINGPAVGAGLTWTMQCDLRYVAEDAKLAFSFNRRGVLPELASHVIVARVAGMSNALDLLMSGRTFLGSEAAALGLASQAVPAAQVLDVALEKAREFAVYSAPVSMAISKRLVWESLEEPLSTVRRREGALFTWTTRQPDSREGTASFLQKRDPDWAMTVNDNYPEWPA
jgi:enoyl-CoA hydratase/carnithine racemase